MPNAKKLIQKLLPLLRLVLAIAIGSVAAPLLALRFVLNPIAFLKQKDRSHLRAKLDDPKWGTHGTFESQGGVKLHYVESGSPSNPLLLFIHGFPEFWYMWNAQIPAFNAQYHVVAFDMRGYNDSDKPQDVKSYATETLNEDVRQVILKFSGSSKKAFVVAHDWGGIVASSFACKHPEYIEKLILLNTTYTPAFADVLATKFEQLRKSWYVFLFQLPIIAETFLWNSDGNVLKLIIGGSMNAEQLEYYKYALLKPGAATGMLNYYRYSMTYGKPPKTKADAIVKVPTVLIWGEKDTALSMHVPESFKSYFQNLKLIYEPDYSHWILHENSDLVNKHIREALESK